MVSHTKVAFVLTLGFAGLFGGAAQAQSFHQIDRLAVQLQRQARELHREAHTHFRPTPQYQHLERDLSEIDRLAAHIHQLVDRRAGLDHVRAEVTKLDRLYHHAEEVIAGLASYRQIDRRTLDHFRRDLAHVGRTIHQLEDAVGHSGHSHGHDHGHGHDR